MRLLLLGWHLWIQAASGDALSQSTPMAGREFPGPVHIGRGGREGPRDHRYADGEFPQGQLGRLASPVHIATVGSQVDPASFFIHGGDARKASAEEAGEPARDDTTTATTCHTRTPRYAFLATAFEKGGRDVFLLPAHARGGGQFVSCGRMEYVPATDQYNASGSCWVDGWGYVRPNVAQYPHGLVPHRVVVGGCHELSWAVGPAWWDFPYICAGRPGPDMPLYGCLTHVEDGFQDCLYISRRRP